MSNPVLILTFNNLDLTRRCVESVRNQDIETRIVIIDNGSTDGTREWLQEFEGYGEAYLNPTNRGVSFGWNVGLENLFSQGAEHCFVVNNDTVLPRWWCRTLLSYDGPFVTGVAIDTMPLREPDKCPLSPHPDFSAFLIRKECWQKVGAFDEAMQLYVQDCDYHVRAHRLGVPLMKACVEYFHVNSQTMRRASPDVKAHIATRANADREVFRSKYGCVPGTPAYSALFEENHG